MTAENDIVLIHMENEPVSFARIEDIRADAKPNWYVVKLLMLQVPLQVVSWILREEYIDGADFSMGGKAMRLEKVVCPQGEDLPEAQPERESRESGTSSSEKDAPIISLADVRKNRDNHGADS